MGKTQKAEKKILVTGGTGFIGTALCLRLVEEGCKVHVLTRDTDSSKSLYLKNRGVIPVNGAVEDKKRLSSIKGGYDTVFHLAVSYANDVTAYRNNVYGTRNMLEFAVDNDIKRFIFASSIEAVGAGRCEEIPLDEKAPCLPVSEYGRAKKEGEKLVKEAAEKQGIKVTIARIGNVYGPGGLNFVHPITEAILKKSLFLNALPLYKDRLMQPIYIEDLVEALYRSIETEKEIDGVFNFTGNTPVSAGEWFASIASLLGCSRVVDEAINKTVTVDNIFALKESDPHIGYFMAGNFPYIHRSYSDAKLKSIIGDYQQFNLYKGVAYTLEWLYRSGYFDSCMAA